MSDTFKQCRFRRDNKSSKVPASNNAVICETIAYIPSWAAVVGNRVQLKTLDGAFWEVLEAGNEIDKDTMDALSRGYKDFQDSLKGGGIDEQKAKR